MSAISEDIVDRLRQPYATQYAVLGVAADYIVSLRNLLATARAEAADDTEAAYARGYADATKSIAAVQIRSHG